MAEWWNGEMAGWLPTYFIYGTHQRHQHLLIFYSIDVDSPERERDEAMTQDDIPNASPLLAFIHLRTLLTALIIHCGLDTH
jgi:hypothetical protein